MKMTSTRGKLGGFSLTVLEVVLMGNKGLNIFTERKGRRHA